MNSFGRLKILKQIDGGETQSYLVFDPERGREVLLHILPQERTAENRAVWERLEKGLEAARKIVLDRGDLLGVEYVITEYIRKFESLSHLLEPPAKQSSMAAKPIQPASSDKKVEAAPGEFTKFFQASPGSPTSATPTEAPPRDDTAHGSDAGEFTRMFHPEQSVPPPPAAAAPSLRPDVPASPAPAAPPETGPEPGEFTRLFQSSFASSTAAESVRETDPPHKPGSSASLPAARLFEPVTAANQVKPAPETPVVPEQKGAPAPPPPSPGAGAAEFARYFQNPLGKGLEEVNFSKKAPAPAVPAPKQPGEFTKMFGRPFAKDAQPSPPEWGAELGGATGVFSSGSRNPAQGQRQAPSQASEPGEYTRIFNSPAPPPAAGTSAPQPPPQPARAGMPALLFAILGLLLVIAIALVLYFVLKH